MDRFCTGTGVLIRGSYTGPLLLLTRICAVLRFPPISQTATSTSFRGGVKKQKTSTSWYRTSAIQIPECIKIWETRHRSTCNVVTALVPGVHPCLGKEFSSDGMWLWWHGPHDNIPFYLVETILLLSWGGKSQISRRHPIEKNRTHGQHYRHPGYNTDYCSPIASLSLFLQCCNFFHCIVLGLCLLCLLYSTLFTLLYFAYILGVLIDVAC